MTTLGGINREALGPFFYNGLLFISWADLLVFFTSVIRPTRALILILSIHVTKGEEGEGNLAA
jgi:hypothetical protein